MKKTALFMAFVMACSVLASSCGNNNNTVPCDIDIEPAPTPICIIVNDTEGNNLLDPDFEGNILESGIEVIYGGEKYPLSLTPTEHKETMGLHTGNIGEDKIPGIMFWFFFVGRNSGGDEFTIEWGDESSDKIKFDYYYTVVDCELVAHIKTWLNDKVQSENSLVVTIVK